MKNNSSLMLQLKSELASLLEARVNQYHQTHLNQVEFLNRLITCPIEDCWDSSELKVPMRTIGHFLECLNIKFIAFNTLSVSLNSDLKPQYHFSCFPVFMNDDSCFDDEIYITYCNGEVTYDSYDGYFDNILSSYTNEMLMGFISDLQGELSFGTLQTI